MHIRISLKSLVNTCVEVLLLKERLVFVFMFVCVEILLFIRT